MYPIFNYGYFYSVQFPFLRPSKAVENRRKAQWVLAFSPTLHVEFPKCPYVCLPILGVQGLSLEEVRGRGGGCRVTGLGLLGQVYSHHARRLALPGGCTVFTGLVKESELTTSRGQVTCNR